MGYFPSCVRVVHVNLEINRNVHDFGLCREFEPFWQEEKFFD